MVRQNTAALYSTYYADDMFRPLWAIFRSQNVYRGKLYRNIPILILYLEEVLVAQYVYSNRQRDLVESLEYAPIL